jgi:hypothetical protein
MQGGEGRLLDGIRALSSRIVFTAKSFQLWNILQHRTDIALSDSQHEVDINTVHCTLSTVRRGDTGAQFTIQTVSFSYHLHLLTNTSYYRHQVVDRV